VEGKGSFQNSPGLKEFSRQMMEGGRRDFVVDLANCPAMDSTFMGTLAGLALRLRENGHLWVVNRNERNSELLQGLGLDALFSEAPVPGSAGELVAAAVNHNADKALTREVMREAHEACVVANPANAAKFRDVLEHLKNSPPRN
jgi:anti-anti-sigma regulatory factor